MKVLVTGATGSIGCLVVKELLKLKYKVIATSRNVEKAKKVLPFDNIVFIPYDINGPIAENLFTYFKEPDLVIHLAWDKLNDYKNEEHLTTILNNHKFFVSNLIKNGLKDFNGVGTCYEYGLREGILEEELEADPTLPYSRAKNELKIFIENLKNAHAFTFKWIRIFYVFGKMQERKNLYTQLNLSVENKEEIFNMSGGEQIRDFLTPNETAENIVSISLQKKILGVVNCCSGKPVKLKNYIYNYLNENNFAIKLNLGYYPYLSYEPMETWGSIIKLNNCKKAFNTISGPEL